MTLLLLTLPMSLAAKPKPLTPPASLAQVTVTSEDGSASYTLHEHARYPRSVIGNGPHQEQPSTQLRPELARGDGEVRWLVGYDLSAVNHPGDVRITVSLVLELGADGAVRALWHEDRMAIPTELWAGTGTLTQADAGADALELSLVHTEYGEALTVSGLLRQ